MRPYKGDEVQTAKRLHEQAALGNRDSSQRHEYLGGIDPATWKLICFRTNGRPDGVDLGQEIDAHIIAGGEIIIHHNHVGLHSLSGGDWTGLVENRGLLESWVHCWDGTRYWGRLIPGREQEVLNYCKITTNGSRHVRAVNLYTDKFTLNQKFAEPKFATFIQEIGPHIVNTYMQKNSWVEYEAGFGEYMAPLSKEAEARK